MSTNKDYCTQNGGDCETCSLVNYGRDCRNKLIETAADRTRAERTAARAADALQDTTAAALATVKQIDKDTFEREMRKAQTMQSVDRDRAEYWSGVQRGLRRAYHGEAFGTAAEHALWLSCLNDGDPFRQQRGQGYRDGLAGGGILSKDTAA